MESGSFEQLDAVERWGPFAFVVGGFLLIVSFLIPLLLGLSPTGGTRIVVSLGSSAGGLVVVIGLSGLCSDVHSSASRIAVVGGAATVVAALAFIGDAAVTIDTVVAGTPLGPPMPPGMLTPLVVAFAALGVALVLAGVGGLRASVTPRSVGLLLVGAGLSFPPSVVVHSLVRKLPVLLLLFVFMAFAVALKLAGVLWDAERVVANGWVPPHPPTTDDAPGDGWTSDNVRDGYDVDGSESRTSRMSMETRLQLHRILYEVFGGADEASGRYYALRRAVGRVLNREAAAEQAIAEQEYIIATTRTTDRKGVGTPYWRLGVALSTGATLAGYGIMKVFFQGVKVLIGGGVGPSVWAEAGVGILLALAGTATLASIRRTGHRLAQQA